MRPQWGIGEVLSNSGEKNLKVIFEDGKTRTFGHVYQVVKLSEEEASSSILDDLVKKEEYYTVLGEVAHEREIRKIWGIQPAINYEYNARYKHVSWERSSDASAVWISVGHIESNRRRH